MDSNFLYYEKQYSNRLLGDFEFYATEFLKILDKGGNVVNFKLNFAQKHLHDIAETQLKERGKVRILVLKGRQQGISTYIQARYFHKVTTAMGRQAYILAHDMKATNNLFNICKRFVANFEGNVSHKIENNSKTELRFKLLDSGYKVGTAGSKETGRSATINLFHGSEAAFWKNTEELVKGVMQTIAEDDGTEIFIESTANGMNNWFYDEWQKAIAGNSDFIPVFIPWYWDKNYRVSVSDKFVVSEEEKIIKDKYDLSDEQIMWRRRKISQFSSANKNKDAVLSFNQEYPFTADEAFLCGIRSGRVFDVSETDLVIEPFILPDFWPRINGLDFGWHPDPTAVVNIAYDYENDVVYWVGEYGANEKTPQQHIYYLAERGWDKYITMCDPYGGVQSNIVNGSNLVEIYSENGLDLHVAERMGVYASCMLIKDRILTSRLKIFSSCTRLLSEFRHYVYDEKSGQPKDKNNHFLDAARYATISGIKFQNCGKDISQMKRKIKNKNPWLI